MMNMTEQKTDTEKFSNLSDDYRTKYYVGVVLGVMLNVFIPFFFVIGIVEVFMQQDTKQKAYERLDNPWVAGILRLNKVLFEGFGILLLLLFSIIVLLIIV